MAPSLICVDIGNSRIKLARFAATRGGDFPTAIAECSVNHNWSEHELASFATQQSPCEWWISSVHTAALQRLESWLVQTGHAAQIRVVATPDLPLQIDTLEPTAVGMDRLVCAVAANVLRNPALPAVVIAVGSAITVNLVDAEGVFRGGAILPGIEMSARGMHQFTDRLPLIADVELVTPPHLPGRDTISAMKAGLFWGAVGGMRELIERMTSGKPRNVILTGGAAPRVAELLSTMPAPSTAMYVPNLALCGIALLAQKRSV